MDVPVEHFLKIKAIAHLAEFVDVIDFAAVEDVALAADGGQRALVRVHRREDDARVGYFAVYILRSVIPVDADRLDRLRWIVVGVQEFHDAREVVGLAGRLAYQVDVVYAKALWLEMRRTRVLAVGMQARARRYGAAFAGAARLRGTRKATAEVGKDKAEQKRTGRDTGKSYHELRKRCRRPRPDCHP